MIRSNRVLRGVLQVDVFCKHLFKSAPETTCHENVIFCRNVAKNHFAHIPGTQIYIKTHEKCKIKLNVSIVFAKQVTRWPRKWACWWKTPYRKPSDWMIRSNRVLRGFLQVDVFCKQFFQIPFKITSYENVIFLENITFLVFYVAYNPWFRNWNS